MIDLEDLRYFASIAQCGSMTMVWVTASVLAVVSEELHEAVAMPSIATESKVRIVMTGPYPSIRASTVLV